LFVFSLIFKVFGLLPVFWGVKKLDIQLTAAFVLHLRRESPLRSMPGVPSS